MFQRGRPPRSSGRSGAQSKPSPTTAGHRTRTRHTKQGLANSKEQFEQSPSITRVVLDAVIAAMDNYQTMGSKIFQDQTAMNRFKGMLVDHVYDRVNAQAPPGP